MAAIGTTPLEDRVWIVTGANSGIGKATARGLASFGGSVILACRNPEKAEAAREEIVRESGNARVTAMTVDLASHSSIVAFAEDINRDYKRLDALVNNAGVYTQQRNVTPDGLEEQFAVNYLGGFLLSHLLLDLLLASAPSRIVNVTSSAHKSGTIDFDDLQGERRYRGYRAYSQSKLAQVFFAAEFARRLADTGLTVNCCHPGLVNTNLGVFESPAIFRFVRRFFKSPTKGAETPIFLAVSPKVASLSGQYFVNRQVKALSKEAQDPEIARRLYDVSVRLAQLES